MAATTASMTLSARPVLAGRRVAAKKSVSPVSRARSVVVRADYIGSATNIVMVANIAATLAMGRFKFSPLGVALPQLRKEQYAANVAVSEKSAFQDPEGFSPAQILAFGSLGHAHGIGMVLGMKAIGWL
mmetsp:Transcript_11068/g.18917  ORF Transcript_11068/g.18917 Transcript_11068/m.18917 type:complete len:129 (+) Transcript_11068:105-491(+)|eukprot:CAMPEP_0198205420 /NCGR_PEP_ID=MMETSP1445-20131203/8960_1 /TAXON_ID=36898 /ORGANISM="Pyramimonas sp., Strain CCMP2087" /LENGTH=128 /DNA_ID=CAMNT_0043877725 /DNA_START=105 /DNA_END=491 /DNA_ORIENTATION=-